MICPRCTSNQSDDIKFCTSCGANLHAVRKALASPGSGKGFDWGDTWVADMFMSGKAQEARKLEMERMLGITPEIKRYNEIKAGVIVSCVGVGVTIFLFFLMQAIANQARDGAELIRTIWLAGLIPFLVGIALIINGTIVSKKIVESWERDHKGPKQLEDAPTPPALHAPNTSEFIPTNMSVTDQTTRHLEGAERKLGR